MSNIFAGIGRAQLEVLDERVKARRVIFERYVQALIGLKAFTLCQSLKVKCHIDG